MQLDQPRIFKKTEEMLKKRLILEYLTRSTVAHMYGSNGHMAIKPGVGSTTTLTDGGLLHATPTSGNSRRPAGPPGFRMPPARGRPYCPAG
ncbi:hypothetical protein D910_03436 [Dendroctonus ponderosae]|uniref:Uncharacterized protein n=1 Tax=Dendroctonus ponderosae TaxID=77166 RepID=U4TYW6_DENPD|nr:hypothetical protein D910_03436 [Dendroctonus ponderosae]